MYLSFAVSWGYIIRSVHVLAGAKKTLVSQFALSFKKRVSYVVYEFAIPYCAAQGATEIETFNIPDSFSVLLGNQGKSEAKGSQRTKSRRLQARRKRAKKRSVHAVHEHFEPAFIYNGNAAMRPSVRS